jgi:hypothetical protein
MKKAVLREYLNNLEYEKDKKSKEIKIKAVKPKKGDK